MDMWTPAKSSVRVGFIRFGHVGAVRNIQTCLPNTISIDRWTTAQQSCHISQNRLNLSHRPEKAFNRHWESHPFSYCGFQILSASLCQH